MAQASLNNVWARISLKDIPIWFITTTIHEEQLQLDTHHPCEWLNHCYKSPWISFHSGWSNRGLYTYCPGNLVPSFQCCMRKMREPDKIFHMSDVVGGTNLFNSSGTKSSKFHPLCHLRDKYYQAPSFFSCNIEKLGGAWIRGYRPSTNNDFL